MRRLPAAVLLLGLAASPAASVDAQVSSTRVFAAHRIDGALDLPDLLGPLDAFGSSLAPLGDLDGDGIPDVAVGSFNDGEAGPGRGAVWILFLESDGTVRARTKITEGLAGFPDTLANNAHFGASLANLGDLDGDGVPELAVGAPGDKGLKPAVGAVWILFLATDGSVQDSRRITEFSGGLFALLDPFDGFGTAVSAAGDLDGDGVTELAVGAVGDDEGGADTGAVWILFLRADGTVWIHNRIAAGDDAVTGLLDPGDQFGASLARLPDGRLLAGATHDDDGGVNRGALWRLRLSELGALVDASKISQTLGGFEGELVDWDHFGGSVAVVGDLDDDGIADVVVGAAGSDDGGDQRGAVWLLTLSPTGQVVDERDLRGSSSDFAGPLANGDAFGNALALLGDLDGSGLTQLAVGAFLTDGDFLNEGAAWILGLGRVDAALVLGDRVRATVAGGEVQRFVFDAVTGSKVRLVARAKGSAPPPTLTLHGPGNVPVVESVPDGKVTRLVVESAPATGEYRLEVSGGDGEYRLRTRGRHPRKIQDIVVLAPGDDAQLVTMPAITGARLQKLRVRSPKAQGAFATVNGIPAELLPSVSATVPAGPPLDLASSLVSKAAGKKLLVGPLDLLVTGDYGLVVDSLQGTIGYAKVRARLKFPKGKAKVVLP